MSKLVKGIGILACIILVISCYLPWTYYADINQTFTGFYSYKNEYGKPGIFLMPVGIIVFTFLLLSKLWAKRINLFLCALLVGYSIKTYVMFTSCYNTYCPEKLYGIYMMLISTIVMLLIVIFSDFMFSKK